MEIGFHAHNNLGVAVTNAMAAYASGASIIDGAAMGLGAGAGNAQLENIVTNFIKIHSSNEYIQKYLDLSDLVSEEYPDRLPLSKSSSVQSALSGVFSGYSPLVQEVSETTGVSKTQIWTELGKRKIVAGQESMIMEIAQDLMNL